MVHGEDQFPVALGGGFEGSGLRATLICGLRVGDVNEFPPQLRAFMKGNKVQVVPLPPDVLKLIVSYALALGRLKPQEYLFRQRSGKPLTQLSPTVGAWRLACRSVSLTGAAIPMPRGCSGPAWTSGSSRNCLDTRISNRRKRRPVPLPESAQYSVVETIAERLA
jgi:hypothetical protein